LARQQRKIRFGIAVNFPATLKEWQETVRKVEGLGYSVLLVADHLSRQWAPLPALVAAANASTTLRLGTQVIANDFRHPVVLAKELATLDVLTGGRLEIGIGVGHPPTSPIGRSDYAQLGREMDAPGRRVERLADTVRLLKTFLASDEPFDFEGAHFGGRGIVPFPRPAQQPRPPVMVAGAGPRMLRLAASEADIVNIAPRPPTLGPTSRGSTGFGLTIHDELAIIREAAGKRYAEIELATFADRAAVTGDRERVIRSLADEMGVSPAAIEEMPPTLAGTPDQIADRILEHRDRFDISYRILPGYLLDEMAPVVARLTGA
jgi:probable F420-dependent oxidoreductase